jgi:hypothetical protein
MLYNIFSIVFPVFGLILLGAALRQSRFIQEAFFTGANKLAFWIALPCLLFHKIALAELAIGRASRILAVMFIATAAVMIIAWIAARLMKMPQTTGAAFIHVAFRGNLAYIAMPVVMYSFQAGNIPNLGAAEAVAVISMAPVVPFYNIAAILLLQSAGSGRRVSLPGLVLESLKNPLLIACLLGLAFSALKIGIPAPAERAIGLIAQSALPLTLLALGASLSADAIRRSSTAVGVATFLKLIVCPTIAMALAAAFGLGETETRIAVCYMAAPTAAAAYVMSDQMKCDPALTGSAVAVSTILSLIVFSAVILLT